MKNVALILASGSGERFGHNIPKQFYELKGKTILEYSIEAFENHEKIDEIILVTNPKFRDLAEEILKKNNYKKVSKLLNGGKTRVESSFIGTSKVEDGVNVLIHDAVRPFIDKDIIDRNIEALEKYNAVGTAIKSSDTIIQVDEKGFITQIPNRTFLRRVQTPQSFKSELIKKAHKLALEDSSASFTDDCGLVVKYNLDKIFIVEGSENNIKITTPEDLNVVKNILENF